MHFKPIWPLEKRSRRGFRGYPLATLAFYGPTDRVATKVTAGIIQAEGRSAEPLQRWVSEGPEVRADEVIARAVGAFIDAHQVKTVVLTDRIIGCPHEEGVDYPLDATCPECPFWANRDRWTGQLLGGRQDD